jgi:hypothetical protein
VLQQAMSRTAVIAMLISAAIAAIAPQAAAADTVIAQERAPTKVSAEINRVVWSSYDPATRDYYLMSKETLGAVTRLPVTPRKVPFDVDLGYLGEGEEFAAYSRCKREPSILGGGSGGLLPDYATGSGCDVYLFDFDTKKESRYGQVSSSHASEFLPSVSPAGRIAFARVYERRRGRRGVVPYLYSNRLGSPHRIHGGPRGKTGLPGPTSIDLKGRFLAYGWDFSTRNGGVAASEARLATVSGRTRLVDRETTGLVARLVLTPGLSYRAAYAPIGIYWGRVVTGETGEQHDYLLREQTSFNRFNSGSLLAAPAPFGLVSVTCGLYCSDSLYYATVPEYSLVRDAGGAPLCGDAKAPPGCKIVLSSPLQFTPR